MARKFIVNEKDITLLNEGIYKITGDEIKHVKAMRHCVSDVIIINNINFEITEINKKYIICRKLGEILENISRNVSVTLFQSFLKGDKMELVTEKSVEIGSKKIVPFFSTNTVVKLDDKTKIKRKDKLTKISLEAIKQCGRTDKFEVCEFVDFNTLLKIIEEYDICIFAYENEKKQLKDVINTIKNTKRIYKNIAIIIGPEGGFTENEVLRLNEIANVNTVSLGNIIQKAETAGIYLQSIITYEFEENI